MRMRGMPSLLAALACTAGGATAGGCGAQAEDGALGPLTVYVSSPLRGPAAPGGEDVRDGAELALEQAGGEAGGIGIEARFLDDTAGSGASARWSPAAVAENARAASQDTSAIAYIGDFESGATRVSLPITNQAMLPQVSAASTALDLVTDPEAESGPPPGLEPSGERTFLRVIPDDRVQAEAAAAWARELGARRVLIVNDGSDYGDVIAEEFSEQAETEGLSVIAERELAPRSGPGKGLGLLDTPGAYRADLIYLAGASRGLLPRFPPGAIPQAQPPPILLASDALLAAAERPLVDVFERSLRFTSSAQTPEQLPPAGQEFVTAFQDEYGRAPGPYAAYGYEAMALVLDAIERAGAQAEDRRAVLDALLATSDRDSVLGNYSITAVGDTTLETVAGYRVERGRPVFDRALKGP